MKNTTKIFLTILFFTFFISANAQQIERNIKSYKGLGFGLDYGGVGYKYEYMPTKYFGLFAGIGYNLYRGIGWNLGGSFKIIPDKRVTPTISALWGYNAYEEFFRVSSYGLTLGAGTDIRTSRKGHKLSLNVLLPIWTRPFSSDYRVEFTHQPILFSIGFNFAKQRR